MQTAVAREILLLFLPLLPITAKNYEFAGNGALHMSVAVKMEAALVFMKHLGVVVRRNQCAYGGDL